MSAQFQIMKRLVIPVPVAGTPVQVAPPFTLYARSLIVQAHYANAGNVYIGDSAANAAPANAHALIPLANFSLNGDELNARSVQFDLSDLWINADNAGDKVILTYLEELLHQ